MNDFLLDIYRTLGNIRISVVWSTWMKDLRTEYQSNKFILNFDAQLQLNMQW